MTVQMRSLVRRLCACVWERERERETVTSLNRSMPVCVCVCEREREREREMTVSHHSGVYSASEIVLIVACLQTHHQCVCHATLFLSRAWTDGKTKDITVLLCFSDAACGVRPITMHWVSWPIRVDCACRKEGLCRKRSVWERRGIEDLQ